MQTTEVTQGQWRAVMGSNPAYFQNCGDDCPVEQVSWDDIQTFIAVLNTRGEGIYRLPTEAEWEYAARAGSTAALANGGTTVTDCSYDQNLDAMGWYCGNAASKTHPVAQKQPNAWGLYDMHGNSGNGVRTGTAPTRGPSPTRQVPHTVRSGSYAAAVGSMAPGTAVRRVASTTGPTTGTTASGSGLFCPRSSELKQGSERVGRSRPSRSRPAAV